MEKNKLKIEFTKTDTGVQIEVLGQDKTIPWADIVADSTPKIVDSLRKTQEATVQKAKEDLVEQMAKLADKSVEDIRKELSKMKGPEEVNLAKMGAKYMEEFLKKMNKKGKK